MNREIQNRNLKPFKKGEDERRAKGKPKGTLHSKTIIRKWLEIHDTFRNPITEQFEKITILDSVILALIAKARKGDVAAFNALLDRSEGKPVQSITGADGDPLIPKMNLDNLSTEELQQLLILKEKLK